jgi:hypothetical protein
MACLVYTYLYIMFANRVSSQGISSKKAPPRSYKKMTGENFSRQKNKHGLN